MFYACLDSSISNAIAFYDQIIRKIALSCPITVHNVYDFKSRWMFLKNDNRPDHQTPCKKAVIVHKRPLFATPGQLQRRFKLAFRCQPHFWPSHLHYLALANDHYYLFTSQSTHPATLALFFSSPRRIVHATHVHQWSIFPIITSGVF